MGKLLLEKLKEASFSILPISILVIILSFTPLYDMSGSELVTFIIAAVLLVIGMALFTLGADIAMVPMGRHVGSGLTKKGKLWLILIVCLVFGVIITIAEPDLQVLAGQVATAFANADLMLIIFVSGGVGIFLMLAIIRIVFKRSLSSYLMFFYLILFALASLVMVAGNGDMLALAFDSGGVTTGPITVPFVMALGAGIAAVFGGKNAKENSFGFVALCSIGAVMGVLILSIFSTGEINYSPDYQSITEILASHGGNIFFMFMDGVKHELGNVALCLGLLVGFFLICQFTFLRLPLKKLLQIFIGILYTFVGLVIFLAAVNVGFMPIGYNLGQSLAEIPGWLVAIGFVIGFLAVMAEPAVHVLNKQVEEVTGGQITKRSMLIGLTVGVGIAIALTMIRIIFGFSIMWYLVPGYIISLLLSFYVPRVYTAIAFDSGGVASGPIASCFVLPLCIGACFVSGSGSMLEIGFGAVAMIAMTPLITIQLLGFKAVVSKRVRSKIALRKMLDEGDRQVIEFN